MIAGWVIIGNSIGRRCECAVVFSSSPSLLKSMKNFDFHVTDEPFVCRYMKYLYPFECEKKGLSSPGELQAAIDSNRREGRRPSYTNSLYRYSPSPSSAPHALLSSPTMQTASTGNNGLNSSVSPNVKKTTGMIGVLGVKNTLPRHWEYYLVLLFFWFHSFAS